MKNFIILLCALFIISINSSISQWTEVNNGFYGGLTTCFAVKDGYLFAGTLGNVYRSSDNGSTWEVVRTGLPLYGIRALLVVGTSIYAGTSGGGVYVTANNGGNWNPTNTGLTNLTVLSLHFKGIYLFAGTTNGGLYVSTNLGATWQLSNTGIPSATVNNFITVGDSIYAATGGGVYLSSNNGTNWTAKNNGLTSTNINSITYDGTKMYAASHTDGVFASTNKGDYWNASNNGITNNSILDIKNNITKVFAGTNGGGVFYSSDGGASWSAINNGLFNTYVLKIFFSGPFIYAGTDGGAFYTSNEGTSWNDITNGLTNSSVMYITKDVNSNMYAGTYGRGAFKSTNNGASWFEINNGLEELYCYSLITYNNYLFGGLWNGQVCRSTDLGGNWSTVVLKTIPRSMVWSFARIGSNIFYGNSVFGVYLTTDNGTSWSPVNNGLTNTNVRCLTSSGTNLFAGTSGGGVFITTNNGTNWQAVNTGLTNLNIVSLASSGSNIYAGTSAGGVFYSSNNGTNWQLINSGMGNQDVRSIVVNGSGIIAATGNGVYYSSNNGASWQTANGSLLNLNDWSLLINGTDVFLGTYGNGVYKAPLSAFSGTGSASITTGSVPSAVCVGSIMQVPYSITGTFNPGNIFTAQLSNASGSFTSPVNIGSITSTSSGTITSTIPNGMIPGNGYRIRVIGSNPYTIGSDNGYNITINAKPAPVINGPDTACQFSTKNYNAVGVAGHSYLWSVIGGSIVGNNNQPSVVIYWTTTNPSGTLTLIETVDASNCTDSSYKTVIVNPTPNPSISGADTACNKTTNTYSCSFSSGRTYNWNVTGGSVANSNNNIANIFWNTSNTVGSVSVTETVNATGCNATTSKTVTILKSPVPVILGDFDVCNNSIQNYSTTFTIGNSYLWKAGGGNIIGANNQINVSVNWNTSQSSSTLTLVETNSITLCKDSTVKIIIVRQLPSPSFSGPNLSYADSIANYSTTALKGNSFKWNVKGGTILGPKDNIDVRIKWLSPPSGTVTLVQTVDSTGCSDSASSFVIIKPFSTYFSGSRKVCENSYESYIASSVSGCSYSWAVAGGEISGQSNLSTIWIHWFNAGNGLLSLTMRIDSSGYSDSSFAEISIYPKPSLPPVTGVNSSCVNKIESYSTTALSGYTFNWIAVEGFIVSDDNQPTVQVRWLTEPSGTITVIKTITGTGCSSSASQIVSVYPSPSPKIQGAKTALNNSDEHYSVTDNPGSTYKWIVTGGSIKSADNLSEVDVHWGEGTSGQLKVVESNSSGCADSNEINVALFVSSVDDFINSSNIRIKIVPNPVSNSAVFEISTLSEINADIQIVNSLGIIVKDFGNVILNDGFKKLYWNGNDLYGVQIPSGIYFIKVLDKYGVFAEKVMVVK